ncbi:DUF3311 domain-containing protein [Natronobiforma cellulositropha]|uniref:DUF3311 domain-containing protein n=1 Tax=Natronobiforma cellulositropha TaxID=1679076 RepID=UPI0021D5C9C6|nr:DUF3311 domain-containing protein [Natronobiforma cellulositropha]
MHRRRELVGWATVGVVLCALAIPWFLWGSSTVVFGLPLWLWWHVGWMVLASAVFWLFARRAWGLGVETADSSERASATASVGDGGGSR